MTDNPAQTLTRSVAAWPGEPFAQVLKQELLALAPDRLPLQQAAVLSGYIDEHELDLTVLKCTEQQNTIVVRLGVFFNEFLAGCNCDSDPQPIQSYCELELHIDKLTGHFRFQHSTSSSTR